MKIYNHFITILFKGITSSTIKLDSSVTENELLDLINKLNKDDKCDGILVQLPVPDHVSERRVCNAVDPKKDVDGFHINNIGKLCSNVETFVPCTALAVIELLKRFVYFYQGMKVKNLDLLNQWISLQVKN